MFEDILAIPCKSSAIKCKLPSHIYSCIAEVVVVHRCCMTSSSTLPGCLFSSCSTTLHWGRHCSGSLSWCWVARAKCQERLQQSKSASQRSQVIAVMWWHHSNYFEVGMGSGGRPTLVCVCVWYVLKILWLHSTSCFNMVLYVSLVGKR